jgi:hypothetical protein
MLGKKSIAVDTFLSSTFLGRKIAIFEKRRQGAENKPATPPSADLYIFINVLPLLN